MKTRNSLQNSLKSFYHFRIEGRKNCNFKETYSLYLVGFNDAEVRKVYNTLPASSFTDDKSTFEKNVSAISDEIRSEQERFRLLELWEENRHQERL